MDNNHLKELATRAETLAKQLEEISIISKLEALIEKIEALLPQLSGSSKASVAAPPKEAPKSESVSKTEVPLKESLEALAEVTSVKDVGEKKFYLLHRPTKDNEYSASKRQNSQYETMDQTEWIGDVEESQNKQIEKNPVVSAWIPQDAIDAVPNGKPNEGSWDGLGKNPYAKEFRVLVKPGIYDIYQELKKAQNGKAQ